MDTVLLLRELPSVLYAAAAVLGLCVGSFLNVVIHRLPRVLEHRWLRECREFLGQTDPETETEPEGLVRSRSRCPHCGHRIKAIENIPLVSYAMLRARCSECGGRISWRYPFVEVLTATLSLAVVHRFGLTPEAAAALVLTWSLIALSFIDIDHRILPDAATIPGVWLGLALNLFGTFTSLHSAVIGAIVGYLFLWLVFHAYRLLTGKEGMGFGDFKLLALFGAWLGYELLAPIVLLSALTGSIVGLTLIVMRRLDRHHEIPFGPYLAAAGWTAMLWGDAIVAVYLPLLGLAG